MKFYEALKALEDGNIITRIKWQDKAKVYLVYDRIKNYHYVEVRTVGNCIMYAASSEDLLADDWVLVKKEISVDQLSQEEIVL